MATLEEARRFYAEEIRAVSDIQCDALIDAVAKVPREAFLGPGPWPVARPVRTQAGGVSYRTSPDADPRHIYHNVLVGIDVSRKLNNGQPSACIGWIDSLKPRAGLRALHIGCGVGYYTAILAEVVGPAGSVVAHEIDAGLAERARANLAPWPQVRVVAGDGALLDPGPFDIGYVNCGAARLMPAWLASLQRGGRMLVPHTIEPTQGGMTLLVEHTGERWPARFTGGVMIYPCESARDAAAQDQLRELFKRRDFIVQSLRRDAHERDATCGMHLADYCLSSLPPG